MPVDLLEVGDEVAARHEGEPTGEVEWKPVEATFRRTGRILHAHGPNGELIRTTPEHPFWVEGKGWTPAGALQEGDRIATLVGDSVAVSEVYDTEQWEPVYNIRVADFHTYFVGDETWGFALWAHNAYYTPTQVTSGPLAGKWLLEDQTASPTRGLQVLETSGRLQTFTTQSDALNYLATLTTANRLTYGPTGHSSDTPLRRACDAILAALGSSAITGTAVPFLYAAGQPLAGQHITDVDILSPSALIEAKSDGVSLRVIQEKVANYNKLFDPAVCASPLSSRPIIFYCEGLSRDRLAKFRAALTDAAGHSSALVVNTLNDLIGLIS